MKDVGFGQIIYVSAQFGRVKVDSWHLGNFQPGFVVGFRGVELEANEHPIDLTVLFSIGDYVNITAEGKPRGPLGATGITVLTPATEGSSSRMVVKGSVVKTDQRGTGVRCERDGEVATVFVPNSAFLRPPSTPFFTTNGQLLPPGAPVVVKIQRTKGHRNGQMQLHGICMQLQSDPMCMAVPSREAGDRRGSSAEAIGSSSSRPTCSAAASSAAWGGACSTRAAGSTVADAQTQTDDALLRDALAATRKLIKDDRVDQEAMVALWTACPKLVRSALDS